MSLLGTLKKSIKSRFKKITAAVLKYFDEPTTAELINHFETFYQTIKEGLKSVIKKATSALLKLLGATTAAELIFFCAFKGAMVCGGLGLLFFGIGNIAGLIVGAVLGAGIAGGLLFLVYKGLIVVDKSLGDGTSQLELIPDNPNENKQFIQEIINIRSIELTDCRTTISNNALSLNQSNSISLTSAEVMRLSNRISTSSTSSQPQRIATTHSGNAIVTVSSNTGSNPQSSNDQSSYWQTIFGGFKKFYQWIKSPFEPFIDFFKIAGGAAALGSIGSCAYYGSMIGGSVGHLLPIPVIGPVVGYIAGGALGSFIATIVVIFVGKGIVKADRVLSDKKEPVIVKANLTSELTQLKSALIETKNELLALKTEAEKLIANTIGLIEKAEKDQKAKKAQSEKDSGIALTEAISHVSSTGNDLKKEINPDDIQSSIETDTSLLLDKADTASPAIVVPGSESLIKRIYNFIKKPAVIILGVPAAAATVLSCAYYGGLIGTAMGSAIPGIGNLAGLIIGSLLGATVAGGAILYLTASGLMALDKTITSTGEQHTLLNKIENTKKEFSDINNEMRTFNDNLITNNKRHKTALHQLYPDYRSDEELHGSHTARNISLSHANTDTVSRQDIHNNNPATIEPRTPSTEQKKGFFTDLKDKFVALIDKITTPVLVVLGGTAGALTIGTCAYYGVMLGGSIGTLVFPVFGNIIGMVAGGIFGGIIGFGFVTLAAKVGITIHEKITHSKEDTVKQKIQEISDELTITKTHINEMETHIPKVKEIHQAFHDNRTIEVLPGRIADLNSAGLSDFSQRQNIRTATSQSAQIPSTGATSAATLTSSSGPGLLRPAPIRPPPAPPPINQQPAPPSTSPKSL